MANNEHLDDIPFNYPEPAPEAIAERLTLWSTHYYVHEGTPVAKGQPLLDMHDKRLGPKLTTRDFCKAAVEATVRIASPQGEPKVYNYAGFAKEAQCDCAQFYPHLPPHVREELGRMRWRVARGTYGDGVKDMILVPFRSIAVDPQRIPFGSLIYIALARGKRITLPSGATAIHDGYFFAADAGGNIKQNHIDVFGGLTDSNPFPDFIKDNPAGTFEGLRINDAKISSELDRLHRGQFEADLEEDNPMRGISTDIPCTTKADCIKQAGYDFVFRYYAEHTGRPEKILKPEEAAALARAGLQIGVVFQNRRSDKLNYFGHANGLADGKYAYRYAQQMRQPAGSAIYFGVDLDIEPRQMPAGLPEHFPGILEGFNSVSNNQPIYTIGVYGSGLVCEWLRNRFSFVKYSWLGKPPGWTNRETYRDWTVKQFNGPGVLCEMTGGTFGQWELNETKNTDFGQFIPQSEE